MEDFKGIAPNDVVTVTQTKHVIEIQYMEKMNHEAKIKKLDKDTYLVVDTGEVKEFNHIETRDQSHNSLRQTFKKVRYLINNNFEGKRNELHVTLTYKENMTDTERLYKDFDGFMKKLRYKYKKTSTIDYISVVEPHGRGAWHCHVLLRFNDLERIFIPNKVNRNTGISIDAPLRDMWGQGNVTIKALNGVDNIGAYLSAYLADIELNDDTPDKALTEGANIKVVEGKKYIKGGRLHMYPAGMNLYRKSKGILYPQRERMTYEKAQKKCGSQQPHYIKTYKVETDDFENTIHFQQYNLKRLRSEAKQ